jgi:hypothetical protein
MGCEVRLIRKGANGYALYVDGHEMKHVLAVTPSLTPCNEVQSVTITLAVREFHAEPMPTAKGEGEGQSLPPSGL